MIKISPLTDNTVQEFTALFKCYYAELGCADDAGALVEDYIIPDLLAGLLKIELAHDGKSFVGFVIYQIDDITNDWNFKEGWGDIREIYTAPFARRQGIGKLMLYTAEMKLKESGAVKSYALPYEGAIPFFTACGYIETDAFCDDLDCAVYEKTNINNCCKNL